MSQEKDSLDLNLDLFGKAGVKGTMALPGSNGDKLGVSGVEVWNVLLDDLEFVPGLNVPGRPTPERIEQIARLIENNGYDRTQPISGFIGKRKDGTPCVYVSGGHTRTLASRVARDRGMQHVKRIPLLMQPSNMDMKELNYSVSIGNANDPLTPYGVAIVAKRALDMKDPEEVVAKRLGITLPYMRQIMELLTTPEPMQKMLAEDKVSATLAGKVLKEEGAKGAAKTLKAAQQLAEKEAATKRATAKPGTKAEAKANKAVKVTEKHVKAVKEKAKATPAPTPAAAPAEAPKDTAFDSLLRAAVKMYSGALKNSEWAEHGHNGDPDAIDLEREITRLISDLGKANACIDAIGAVINDDDGEKKPRVLALLSEYNDEEL